MKLWQIAAVLIAGIGVGIALPDRLTNTFGEATLIVFLPALIFEAAWNLDFHEMRRAWKPIVLLAVPGVFVTAAIIAVCVRVAGGAAWPAAILLGAILSATDPVAVIALFRQIPVPKRLATIVQSETLLNDAIAVVLYRAVSAAVLVTAGSAGVAGAAGLAIAGVAVGIGIGFAFAFLTAIALAERVSAPVQTAATILGAYATYFIAEYFGWSGIFAVLTFGIVLRELERHRITVTAAVGVSKSWYVIAAIANVALFFLIGAALDLTRLEHTLPAAGVTVGAVLLSRVAVAYGLLAFVHVKPAWRTVVRMAGVRGALSLALALATPARMPGRTLIVDATFAVVVVTILVGALTLRRRVGALDLE